MKKVLLSLFMLVSLTVSGLAVAYGQMKPVWVDVRTQAEFDAGHLDGAALIPYNVISSKIFAVVKDKNQPINLYCRSGRRAEIALRTLERLGYTNVQNLGSYEVLKSQL